MQQVKSRIQRNKLDLIINEYPNLQLKCCTRIAWNITNSEWHIYKLRSIFRAFMTF